MEKINNKFIEIVNNLKKYLILKHDPKSLLITTTISIVESKTYNSNMFTPLTKLRQRQFPVLFILTFDSNSKMVKEYQSRQIPVLEMGRYCFKFIGIKQEDLTLDDIEDVIDAFVAERLVMA